MAQIEKILVKNVRIINPNSVHHNTVKDMLLVNGVIQKIAPVITDQVNGTFEADNLHVSTGWVDLHAQFCDPGFEHKEDIATALEAAAYGGFTTCVSSAQTQPKVYTKAAVEYVKIKSAASVVTVLPMGLVSEKGEGKNLAELYDMHQHGAVAFFDGKQQTSTGLLVKALQYSKHFNGLIITHPTVNSLTINGQVNESTISAVTGLKGIPALGEEIQLAHDLKVLEYAGGRLHINTISTKAGIDLIKQARQQGLKVTVDIAAHQIAFSDEAVTGFDTNHKVYPPYRTQKDVQAILQALKEGVIDAICSDHTPEDVENKVLEFDLAAFGIIGLQTAYAVANTQLNELLSVEEIIALFTSGPKRVLNMPDEQIEEGKPANLTFFNPTEKWVFDERLIKSKSKNTPFIGQEFIGKALAIANKGQFKVLD